LYCVVIYTPLCYCESIPSLLKCSFLPQLCMQWLSPAAKFNNWKTTTTNLLLICINTYLLINFE
jgi:hypothetical protein